MDNPWLDIPSADYLAHMDSPEVGQLAVLKRIFQAALRMYRPRDVALLGCSTGNGLEDVDPAVTRRVLGVDINPAYVRSLLERFANRGFELTAHVADVVTYPFPDAAFDLAHCALLFEYIAWPQVLPSLARTLRGGGRLSIVLQRPSDAVPAVTPSPYPSLQRLEQLFRFVEPDALVSRASSLGLHLEERWVELLPAGKSFLVLHFQRLANQR